MTFVSKRVMNVYTGITRNLRQWKTKLRQVNLFPKKQNKSLRLFADEFDIQKSLLSRIENGVNEPKLISLWTISEALGIRISQLLKKVEKELPKDFSLIEK